MMASLSTKIYQYKTVIIVLLCTTLALLLAIYVPNLIATRKDINYIKIQNLDFYADRHTRDKDVENIAQMVLGTYVLKNNKNIKLSSVKDVKIRDGSFVQTGKNNTFSVSLLVDIPTIKQTYRLEYFWGEKNRAAGAALVYCPKESELIYEKFDCIDSNIDAYGDRDPIFRVTPVYKMENGFNISAERKSEKEIVVTVTIKSVDNIEFEAVKSLANEYLTDNGINLQDYTMRYVQYLK